MTNQYVFLDSRAVVSIRGDDRKTFLQGLISQDMDKVTPSRAAYGAFLTPQGKYLHDFCIAAVDEAILLDCEADRAGDLIARLERFRLRADVVMAIEDDLAIVAIFGDTSPKDLGRTPGSAQRFESGTIFIDPRHIDLGCRAILPRQGASEALENAGFEAGLSTAYDALRISLTIPDGSRDLEIEKTILLEANFDQLNGVDWEKGCYLGQELTARTRYRGLVKRKLVTVALDAPWPPPGTPILQGGKDVGVLRSSEAGIAIATLRHDALEQLENAPLTAGTAAVKVL